MKRRTRVFAVSMSICMLYQVCFPTIAFALTGGPSQPEVESFEPVGTSEMVDVFSGDFNYNIPLLDVDGYPINIAYHSGVTMDQEASWVGLGWNLNPGVMNRNMRGIPDEFSGDKIRKTQYIKPNRTYGMKLGAGFELMGKSKGDKDKGMLKKLGISASIDFGLGINYNNYTGLGIESSVSPAISASDKSKPNILTKLGLNARLTLATSNKEGLTMTPQIGMSKTLASSEKGNTTTALSNNTSVAMGINSRGGVKALTIQSSTSVTKSTSRNDQAKDENGQAMKDKDGKDIYVKGTQSAGVNLISSTSTISYGTQTYVPSVSQAMSNYNLSANFKIGFEAFSLHPNFSIAGYYSGQEIDEIKAEREAYGNLYAHNFGNKEEAMLDFNREKDGAFSNRNPVLAIPVYTQDLYSASGQGVSGMFKAYRNDIPNVHDPKMVNKSLGGGTGVEIGVGNLFKVGMNMSFNMTSVKGGRWKDGNNLSNSIRFESSINNPFYEPSYFGTVGEKSEVSETNNLPFFQIDQGAVRPALSVLGSSLISGREAESKQSSVVQVDGTEHAISTLETVRQQTKKAKRNILMTSRTVEEGDFCTNRYIEHYTVSDNPKGLPSQSAERKTYKGLNDGKGHHINELGVTRPDGSRYIYGIPAYNNNQYEISFTNAEDPDATSSSVLVDCPNGQVGYTMSNLLDPSKTQITDRANKGLDHAYNVTHIPAYAHSYLLTDVLSADYVDINNNGPGSEDYGNYTHISYYKTHESYKWRVPYASGKANYNEGLKSDKTDDNANIIYGDKEIWHVARIEGKNHYAVFYISEREDGFGSIDEHGGLSTSSPSYKLDKIELYAKNDDNTPVKTVHFEYDYSLCPGVHNNSTDQVMVNGVNINQAKGKLTLKKLYFTYRKSTKGRFNAYTFEYKDTRNPSYNLKGYDRWGNYKPNPLAVEGVNCGAPVADVPLSNSEFPYVDQGKFTGLHPDAGKNKADIYAESWHLSKINLPSGGAIEVEYEADDYAYVQNRRATQMVKLLGFCDYSEDLQDENSEVSLFTLTNELYNERDPKECILFDLPAELDAEDWGAVSKRLKDGFNKYLYYNCLVNLTSSARENYNYEYVSGYTEVADAGVINMGTGRPVGWVKVNGQGGGDEHPVSRTAWQYARMYLPQLVYPGSNLKKKSGGGDVAEAIIRGLAGFIPEAIDMIEGVNNKLRRLNFAKHVLLNKSWIRIENLTGHQLGGGSRVKRLLLHDNWQTHSGSGVNASYGQEYNYKMLVTENGENRLISSGVASYEPGAGSDENPWKMPIVFDKNNIGVPNDEFYSEDPFGESYFPAPSVGYSRVEVKNVIPEAAVGKVNKHGTGKVVHQYYTAKDFPVFTSHTNLEAKSFETSALFSILGFKAQQDMTMAQGFQVELNDMHGKPRATLNYDQAHVDSYNDGDAFSGIKYNYAVADENAEAKKLSNTFQVVDKTNTIRNAQVGIESEMVMDSRMQQSETYSGTVALNLDWYQVGVIPVFSFFVWPDFSSEATRYKSAVLLRVVNRFGILKSTEAFEEGSSVKTENVLLDAETGETLLTRTYNEYKDPVYNFTMPAHWAYDGMGQAYKNIGLKVPIKKKGGSGYLEFIPDISGHSDPAEYFADGDELRFEGSSLSSQKFYVQHVVDGSDHRWYILDNFGNVVPLEDNVYQARIMRSGRRNMQSVPVMQVTSQGDPRTSNKLVFDESKNVLNASAVSYSDKWRARYEQFAMVPLVKRLREVVEITNYLFTSGQLTSANYHTIRAAGTPDDIDITGSGHEALTHSGYYQKVISQCPGDPKMYFLPNPEATYFSISYSQSCSGTTSYNVNTIDFSSVEDILGFSGPANDIVPDAIEFVQVNSTSDGTGATGFNVKVLITYTDASSIVHQVVTDVIIETAGLLLECIDQTGYTYNPFRYATEGVWRKQKDWVFYGERNQASNINLRKDGTYTTFAPFWNNALQTAQWTETGDNSWTCTNEVTKYTQNGEEIENKDALGRYSAALFSTRLFNTPIAVAGNAKHAQIGVEDGEQAADNITCQQKALDFDLDLNEAISTVEAHTGKRSALLENGTQLSSFNNRMAEPESYDNGRAENIIDWNKLNGLFNPDPGKYVISAWVKVSNQGTSASYYQGASGVRLIVETAGGAAGTWTFFPKGQIIEGWQRIEGTFPVESDNQSVTFKLVADGTNDSYFDDIRVHPFDSKMKTYVYDEVTQRLTAELDENNYATFYEYSAEGQLVRVKKETEKGIVTLKEIRSNQHKSTTP